MIVTSRGYLPLARLNSFVMEPISTEAFKPSAFSDSPRSQRSHNSVFSAERTLDEIFDPSKTLHLSMRHRYRDCAGDD